MAASPAQVFARARHFLVEELWKTDFARQSWMSSLLSGLQLAALIVRGFIDDQLLLRASALTYISSLAIIPVLVILLSVIDWLGLSQDLVKLAVNQFLAGNPEAVDRIMGLVDGANIGAFGSLGGALFFVTTILSLRHIEETFNDIWGTVHRRTWFRRFSNYLVLMVIAPLVIGTLFSMSPSYGDGALAAELDAMPMMDIVKGVLLGVGPLLFLFVSFALAYFLLPNTPVRMTSAVIGAAVAALLFSVAQYGYVSFSVGVARYNALFGGFAILPLLMVWIYVSWSIVLLGAEIAYAHQHLARYRREARDAEMDPAEREAVGLRVILEVARAFRDAWPPQTAEHLAERLGSSLRIVTDLLVRYEKAGILTSCGKGDGEASYQLGRPAESIRLGEVLSAVRGRRLEVTAAQAGEEGVTDTVRRVDALLCDVDEVLDPVRARTVGDLLDGLPPQADERTAASAVVSPESPEGASPG